MASRCGRIGIGSKDEVRFGRRWTSNRSRTNALINGDSKLHRRRTHQRVDARWTPRLDLVALFRQRKELISRKFLKPSNGLEPLTRSLPSRSGKGSAGKSGQRDHENPANRRAPPKTSDRVWTRVPGLVFPPCSLATRCRRLITAMNFCPFMARCPVWRDIEFRNDPRSYRGASSEAPRRTAA